MSSTSTKCLFSPVYWRYLSTLASAHRNSLVSIFLKTVNGLSLWNGRHYLTSLPALPPESYLTHYSLMRSHHLGKLLTWEPHFYCKLYSRLAPPIKRVDILKKSSQHMHLKTHKNIKHGLSHYTCKHIFQCKMNVWIDIIYSYTIIM